MAAGINIPEVEAWLADAQFDRPFNVGVSQDRWEQALVDARNFVAEGWLKQAVAFEWLDVELFGCDQKQPLDNPEQGRTGLVLALRGRSVVGLKHDYAVLRNIRNDDCTIQSRWLQRVARIKGLKPLKLIWEICPSHTLQEAI